MTSNGISPNHVLQWGSGPPVAHSALRDRAHNFANLLLSRGIALPGARVVVALRPGPNSAVAMLACWRAGFIAGSF